MFSILSKLIYRFKVTPVKILCLYAELDELIHFLRKCKGLRIASTFLNINVEFRLSDIKRQYRVI